jgi:FkbM family methyltransferase
MGKLMLRAPAPLRSLREVPLLGNFIHRLSYQFLPAREKVWARIEAGPAKGIWIELNPRTGQNYLRGEAERAVQEVLAERLRPGMVFYDLGANVGLFSLLAARLVGTNGKVFSFEPDPETAGRLRRHVARNGFENIEIVEAGVWSSSGQMNFAAADSSSPDRGVGKFVASSSSISGTPTRCVSLDDFVQTAPPPDAIKCDVEGAEVEVFRGAETLLRMRHPWLVCEIHLGSSGRALRPYLSRLGYRLESVDQDHLLAQGQ